MKLAVGFKQKYKIVLFNMIIKSREKVTQTSVNLPDKEFSQRNSYLNMIQTISEVFIQIFIKLQTSCRPWRLCKILSILCFRRPGTSWEWTLSEFQEEKKVTLKKTVFLNERGKLHLIQMFSTWRKNTKTFVKIFICWFI